MSSSIGLQPEDLYQRQQWRRFPSFSPASRTVLSTSLESIFLFNLNFRLAMSENFFSQERFGCLEDRQLRHRQPWPRALFLQQQVMLLDSFWWPRVGPPYLVSRHSKLLKDACSLVYDGFRLFSCSENRSQYFLLGKSKIDSSRSLILTSKIFLMSRGSWLYRPKIRVPAPPALFCEGAGIDLVDFRTSVSDGVNLRSDQFQ